MRVRSPVVAWMVLLCICAVLVSRSRFSADLDAFLPSSPSASQQLLVDELREGVVSRIILLGIEGGEESQLAALSDALAAGLANDSAFVQISNGAADSMLADGEFLLRHRYALNPDIDAATFTADGLRAALEKQLDMLSGSTGMLTGQLLPRDPTGAFLGMLEKLGQGGSPEKRAGVWFSADGSQALLIAHTRAAGFDLDAQALALEKLHKKFRELAAVQGAVKATLTLSGPAVFAVASRADIQRDVARCSVLGAMLVSALIIFAFRSAGILVLILLPVVSGALAGVAAVSLVFGTVHGITLGFGVTLIGEAVDYAIYLFTNTSVGSPPRKTLARIWPTLRLGMLTSVLGFGAMLFTGFPGLAQIGLFSIVGLVVALGVTRWVLPELSPPGFQIVLARSLGPRLVELVARMRHLRPVLIIASLLTGIGLLSQGAAVWDDQLASLSPVSQKAQETDQRLRAELGAPDAGQLVVIRGKTEQEALERAEEVGETLDRLVQTGMIAGYESPATFLPSERRQATQRQAIPEGKVLENNLRQAAAGLPFRAGSFAPFLQEAALARQAKPLGREDLQGTVLALKIEALLVSRRDAWMAMLPLRGTSDPEGVRQGLLAFEKKGVVLLDIKQEADALYRDYRNRALIFSLLGGGAIVLLLLGVLRSAVRIRDVLAPLVCALVMTIAVLLATGTRLNIFHLVALLLVVGVGSNYTLFYERGNRSRSDPQRTVLSLLFCNFSTVIAFGVLSFAATPVLKAIGTTVAVGALLTLIFAAILSVPVQETGSAGQLAEKG
ncbi:MAG: MMPL family transporter [Burkholderiales bacterium]